MHKRSVSILGFLGMVLVVVMCRGEIQALWNGGQHREKTLLDAVTASGTVEVRTVDVASKMAGYLRELRVREGDRLAAGDLVGVVDRPDLEAQISRDRAALRRSRAILADIEAGSRPEEIAEAEARVASHQARYEKARQDFERFRVLHREKVVSDRQFEEFRALFEGTRADLSAAQDRRRLLLAGPRPKLVEAQRAEVGVLEAALALTRSLLQDTRVSAPQSGVVLAKGFERGEFVPVGGVLISLGDLEDCWVRIYVPSPQIGRLRLGGRAEIRVDSYPEHLFPGTVTEIAQEAEFTPRVSLNQQERAGQVFRVKVAVENGEGILKPGMPADVRLP